MYKVSEAYKKAISSNFRGFECRVTIGDTIYTNREIASINIIENLQGDTKFSIGNVISNTATITLLDLDEQETEIDENEKIKVEIGIKIDDENYEYIPMGVYNIENITDTGFTTILTCYDDIRLLDVIYTENTDKPSLKSVLSNIISTTNINYKGNIEELPDIELGVLMGYSCRVVLGFIAGIMGKNVNVGRTGSIEFVDINKKSVNAIELRRIKTRNDENIITINKDNLNAKINRNYNEDNYYTYTKQNREYRISKITNTTDTEELSLGNNSNMTLQLNNPYINEDILIELYKQLYDLSYYPYSLDFQGDLALDIGDTITIVDKKGISREHIVLNKETVYDGTLRQLISADAETQLANTYQESTSQQEQENIQNKKNIVQIQKDADELYAVVYNEDKQASIRLTEKLLEAIAQDIVLEAQNIKLEGLTTINDKFKVNMDGTIEAEDAVFNGTIKGSNIEGGDIQINNDKDEVIFKANKGGIKANFSNIELEGDNIEDVIKTSIETNTEGIFKRVEEGEKKITEAQQMADKIAWIVKNGESESSLELTDTMYKLITDYVLVKAKKIELEGNININDKFLVDVEGNTAIGNVSQDGETRAFEIKNNGNLKIGGLTGRKNSDGTEQGIFEITSKGRIYSRNKDDGNIYVIIDNGKITVKDNDTTMTLTSEGLILNDSNDTSETGGYLRFSQEGIYKRKAADIMNLRGRLNTNSICVRGKGLGEGDFKSINSYNQPSCLMLGDIMIQYGSIQVVFEEEAINGYFENTKNIKFVNYLATSGEDFSYPPFVTAIPNTKYPEQCAIGVGGVTTTGFNIYTKRTKATDTAIFWVAIGKRKPIDITPMD